MLNNQLKVARAKANITQGDLATLVGVSRQTINSIELKKYIPSTELAMKLARVLKISTDELFWLDED